MAFLPSQTRQRLGHRLWGYLLVCAAIGFFIAGAPLWLVAATALVGVVVMLFRPQPRVEDVQDAAGSRPSHAPAGEPDARPIEPAPLIPLGPLLALLALAVFSAWAIHEASRAYSTAARVVPWTLVAAAPDAPEPLAAGDRVLVYRWQRARAPGQFSTLAPDGDRGAPRLVVLVEARVDTTLAAPGVPPAERPVLVATARPDSAGGSAHLALVRRSDLRGVGVGVVWPLERRRSLP